MKMNSGRGNIQIKFEFSEEDFTQVSEYAARMYGLNIPESKRDLIYARISRQMRSVGASSFDSYFTEIQKKESSFESRKFLSLLTTNVTSFFREPHHFDSLKRVLRDRLEKPSRKDRFTIWSAGCSSGQEAFSIASVVHEVNSKFADSSVKVLATDVDDEVLKRARLGTYNDVEVADLNEVSRRSLFESYSPNASEYQILPNLLNLVEFKNLNLVKPWGLADKFDVIFCRNVVIYFDRETQQVLWKRFFDQMNAEGTLFLGQSERISGGCSSHFESVGFTEYRKIV